MKFSFLALLGAASAFAPARIPSTTGSSLSAEATATEVPTKAAPAYVPLTLDEMIRQAATSMKEASNAGVSKQLVRILLPRDAANADFGTFWESSDRDKVTLVPPDESWQGGILQLYRAAAPTAEEIMRKTSVNEGGLPPRITEDRSVDESGVDGVGLLTSEDGTTCYVQPTQELVGDYVLPKLQSDTTTILLNPQWRQVDDALDSASSGSGFFSNLAKRLGGKAGTLQALADAGFTPVYTLEGYVCMGANVRLLQTFGSPVWSVFCERDDKDSFVKVGQQSGKRPTYQDVEKMLQESDIGYKYARDLGMSPKL